MRTTVDSQGHIAFKHQTQGDLRDLFETRKRMYDNVYQHHTSLKMDKIHFCLMKQLGNRLYIYGEKTDDYNIETLIHNCDDLIYLIEQLEYRQHDHNCEHCKDYHPVKSVKSSGGIDKFRFILKTYTC